MAAEAPRTYVDFTPPHSLQEEPDKLSLRVDLSAQEFKKEQIGVQIDNFGRLRISGERADGSRWRRFGMEFRVPDICDAAAIRARLDKDGILLITMPKLSPASAKAKEPKAPDASTGHAAAAAAAGGHQDHEPAGHTGAQQAGAAAAEAEEERGRQRQEETAAAAAAMERPGQEDEQQHPRSDDATAAHRRPAVYGFAKDRRSMLLAIFAAMLALVAAGLFAKYGLMDPSAETTAPSGNHIVSLSDS
ncbi:unnamed protein product [Urochloa humidicola]